MPAYTVEPEAKQRLGLEVAVNGRPIEAAIALRYPEDVAEVNDLTARSESGQPLLLRLHRGTERGDGGTLP